MDAIILPVTLAATAACALLNLWMVARIGAIRRAEKISIGDGGNLRLIARMRAQANFIEFTPFVLILIALIELAIGTENWLWGAAIIYVAARICHVFGMDGWTAGRAIGVIVSLLVTLGLAGYAATLPINTSSDIELIETYDPGSL